MKRYILVAVALAVLGPLACHSSRQAPAEAQAPSARATAAVDNPDAGLVDAGVCSDYDRYKRVYWGDLHTHTGYSVDAYGMGTRSTPADAYLFARGQPLQIATGNNVPDAGPITQLTRPLDFDAITDHSEWLASAYGCGTYADGGVFDPTSPYFNSPECRTVRSDRFSFATAFLPQIFLCSDAGTMEELSDPNCRSVTQSAWTAIQNAANNANDPCHFTAFPAYEWTHAVVVPGSGDATLHKNVIFAGSAVPGTPFDALDFGDATSLWTALDLSCRRSEGCDVLTIPHNSNLSYGMAFDVPTGAGAVRQMRQYQRLVEVIQHKRGSECYYEADGGPEIDPSCAFENYFPLAGLDPAANQPISYVRTGLERGLSYVTDAGVNPLELGFVAATDDHNGTPGNVEESFDGGSHWPGHVGELDDTPSRRLTREAVNNPGGLTAVWAEQNTRLSIFGALKRRETYATSGPRITVRFYQTWESTNYCTGAFPRNVIDSGGAPMGSTVPAVTDGGIPQFIAGVAKDEADLAEIDLVKAQASDGGTQETVYRLPLDGGVAQACVRWFDTSYDPNAPTFYYVRVLEVPTWRWSHYDCETLDGGAYLPDGGNTCDPSYGYNAQIQERAWTSPIWIQP